MRSNNVIALRTEIKYEMEMLGILGVNGQIVSECLFYSNNFNVEMEYY